jgi:AcrR family transcriptional regulator
VARTRALDYDDKQDAILDAAATVLAARGYPTTSMNELAEACGVSKGRIYYYFESKEAILFEILKRHLDRLLEECEAVVRDHDEPREQLEALIRTVLQIYAVSRDKHVLVMTSLSFLPPDMQTDIVRRERSFVTMVEKTLKRLGKPAAQGGHRVVTMLLFGMLNWTYTWYRPGGPVSVDSLVEQAAGIFLDGYLARQE